MPASRSKAPSALRRSARVLLAIFLLYGTVPGWTGPIASPSIARFVEETETAGLQSRFEGEDEFMVGGGVAVFD